MTQIRFGLHFSHPNKIQHVSKPHSSLPAPPPPKPLINTIINPVIGLLAPTSIPLGTAQPVIGSQSTVIPVKGNKKALLIGINYYGTENQLEGCINDVKNMNNVLVNTFHFNKDNIKILTDEPNSTNIPTRSNILKELNNIISNAVSGDEIFIHYSGHGTQLHSTNNDEKLNTDTPNMDDALCPCDFDKHPDTQGFIIDDDLRQIVDKLAIGAKLRFIADCCHSGTILDLTFLYDSNKKDFIKIESELTNSNILSISGCRDNQTSADAYIGNKNSGALTWAILKGFETALKIPTTWIELLILTRHYLAKDGYDQIPMLNVGDKALGTAIIDI